MSRKHIPDAVTNRLYALSGNQCAFPDCTNRLTEHVGNESPVTAGQRAHIVGVGRQGPRSQAAGQLDDLDTVENLILLCGGCHARVDKNPRIFSVEVLAKYKSDHETKMASRDLRTPPQVLGVEMVDVSILPVTMVPDRVYTASAEYRTTTEVAEHLPRPRGQQLLPFVLASGSVWAFHDLRDPRGPFAKTVDYAGTEVLSIDEARAAHGSIYAWLLNSALRMSLRRRGVDHDREHDRYFFLADHENIERRVAAKSKLGRAQPRKKVVRQEGERSGKLKDVWWHLAAQLRVRELTRERTRRRDGFERLLGAVDVQLKRLSDLDAPPDIVFVALPSDITDRYWSVRTFRKGVETIWNLRASIKAKAMQRGVRTQLLTQATIESSLDEHAGDLEHPADLAWNLFVGLYFKAGGFPWTPVGLPDGTCHLGITFYRPHGESSAMRTSVAQAFAENGEAFVLRGNRFGWEGKWPHLPAHESARLAEDVIDRYTAAMGRPPLRLVVHKQSRFFPEERAGLEDALEGHEYDLVSLAPSTAVRVMRHGQYPPPRGACVSVGYRRYLYTTGFVPALGRYPHGHVPAPVQITDHVGDTSPRQLLSEVLLLTKMNWNSARFAERVPVTLRFANEVGSILRDLPDDFEPEARYAFYM